MLLVIDVGNTHTVSGVYHGRKLSKTWRVPTQKPLNKYAHQILRGIGRKPVDGVCVSSVVPWVDRYLHQTLKGRFNCPVIFATADTVGMPIVKCRKKEIGADRLVNAYAAYAKYKSSLIILDFGTATTFDVITSHGEYAGGAIAPGIHLANRSLSDYTAKLPRVDIKKTRRVIGYRTDHNMQAGVFHGYIGLVNHLVRKIRSEMQSRPKVVATGGLAKLISSSTDVIDVVSPNLTLEGLRLVWERNSQKRNPKY